MGVDVTHVDVGGGLGVDYDGTRLDVRRERELLAAGVRERRRLHARRGLPRARAPDAAHHQRVGARAHRAPRAAAAQGDRRRVAVTEVVAARAHRGRPRAAARDGDRLRDVTDRHRAARARDLSRRHVRQGARAGALQQRRALAARAARIAEQIYLATINAVARDASARTATSTRTSSRISTRRSSTATSATSRSSSRCPTAGRSTSSSRSCRSIGWTRSRRAAARIQDVTCDSRRQDRPVRRRQRNAPRPSLELHPVPRRRAVHPRRLPHRRVSGNPRRPAQSVRRYQRRAHPAHGATATRSPTSCTATR